MISYFLLSDKPSSSANDLTKILAAPFDGTYEGLKYIGFYKCKFRADKHNMKSCSKSYGLSDLKNTRSEECQTFRSNERLHKALHNGLL